MPTALIALNPAPKGKKMAKKRRKVSKSPKARRKSSSRRRRRNPYAVSHVVKKVARKKRRNPAGGMMKAILGALMPQVPGAAVGVAAAMGHLGAGGDNRQIAAGAIIAAAGSALVGAGKRDLGIGVGSAGMVVLGSALWSKFGPAPAPAPITTQAPQGADYVPAMGDVVMVGGRALVADGRGGYLGVTASPARELSVQGLGSYSNV
jgi:hypothetical protein